MATVTALLDPTQYVRVNIGLNALMLQAHRDAVRIVFSETKPAKGNSTFHLLAGDSPPMIVEYNDTNIWALATSEHSSLVLTEYLNGYLKIRDELTNASIEGFAYTVSGKWTVTAGAYLAMNLTPASDIIVHKVSTTPGCEVCAYDMQATGSGDGIFHSGNLNFCTNQVTATQAQLVFDAVPQGSVLGCDVTSLDPHLVACQGNKLAFVVKNETGVDKEITITATFEATGDDVVVFGLLPSSFIVPTTEMSIYG